MGKRGKRSLKDLIKELEELRDWEHDKWKTLNYFSVVHHVILGDCSSSKTINRREFDLIIKLLKEKEEE